MTTRTTFELDEGRILLARTPGVLKAWLRDLPAAWTETRERPGAWCPREVVGHLVHGESTDWMTRLRLILEHGEARPFVPFDRAGHDDDGRSLPELLDAFEEIRGKNLIELSSLAVSPSDLELRGTHPDLGPVTLRNLLSTWVAHDQVHIAQIARAMARRYRHDVGPWRREDYMPLLV